MRIALRSVAVLLAVIAYAFAIASVVLAVVDPDQRWTMVVGAVLLALIGTFFVWRFRAQRRT